jgi:hypothetical protein
MINRLVSLGNVIIDIVADVPALPERGGDVLASGVALEVGGGFNLMPWRPTSSAPALDHQELMCSTSSSGCRGAAWNVSPV